MRSLTCTRRGRAGQSQQAIALPDVNVTSTRLGGRRRRDAARRGAPSSAPTRRRPRRRQHPTTEVGPGRTVTASVPRAAPIAGTIITGASSSIITSADIERSPGLTLQDMLAREPGIQVRSLFGSVNGAQTTVDMRGFGATAAVQHAGADQRTPAQRYRSRRASISAPSRKSSIERIEITRGNSGAVLYGDGAVGGVINIITKTGVGLPPSARVQGTLRLASTYREGNVASANGAPSGSWLRLRLRQCRSARTAIARTTSCGRRTRVGDLRWNNGQGTSAYLNLSGDNQHLGLPGGRLVTPTFNQLVTDPRGATTPFDFANKQGMNATAGVTHMLCAGHRADRRRRRAAEESAGRLFLHSARPDFDRGFKATSTTALVHAAPDRASTISAACPAS